MLCWISISKIEKKIYSNFLSLFKISKSVDLSHFYVLRNSYALFENYYNKFIILAQLHYFHITFLFFEFPHSTLMSRSFSLNFLRWSKIALQPWKILFKKLNQRFLKVLVLMSCYETIVWKCFNFFIDIDTPRSSVKRNMDIWTTS